MKIQLKYFVVLLSVICITFLYFLSTLSQPIQIDLYQIPDYEGKQVIVEGTVTEHHLTSYGGHIIDIKDMNADNSTSVIIFVEEATEVEYGDKIKATGKVQKYNDEWEVVVNNARFVEIVQKWSNITFPLWQLAENPSKYLGLNVNISGSIEREYESYFYLTDTNEEHSIVVYYDSSSFYNFSQGDYIWVKGKFLYDEENLRFVINVIDEKHSISLYPGE